MKDAKKISFKYSKSSEEYIEKLALLLESLKLNHCAVTILTETWKLVGRCL